MRLVFILLVLSGPAMAHDQNAAKALAAILRDERPLLAPTDHPGSRARPSILPRGLPAPFLENYYSPPGLERPAGRQKLQAPEADEQSTPVQADPIG